MTDTVDKLLGLADRFAILFADAREARMTELPGSVWVDDAKRAKAELEAALRAALDWGAPVAWITQASEVDGDGNLRYQRDLDCYQADIDLLPVGTKLYAKAKP